MTLEGFSILVKANGFTTGIKNICCETHRMSLADIETRFYGRYRAVAKVSEQLESEIFNKRDTRIEE